MLTVLCLEYKLQLWTPFSSIQFESYLTCGTKAILILVHTFHPSTDPEQLLLRFGEWLWIFVAETLRFLRQNDKCSEELSCHYCIYQRQFVDAKHGLNWSLHLCGILHLHRYRTIFFCSIVFHGKRILRVDKTSRFACLLLAQVLHQCIYVHEALYFTILRSPIDQV